jgi:hypothetical protein
MYLTKSRPDIMTAVSFFGATKSTIPTQDDHNKLYYIVEYIRATANKQGSPHIYRERQCYTTILQSRRQLPDTFRLIPRGKQTLVSTSSTNAKMRALYTLVKDILFIIYICSELNIPLLLPAVIMEDNSAVVTISNEESSYLKKCKYFIMVV